MKKYFVILVLLVSIKSAQAAKQATLKQALDPAASIAQKLVKKYQTATSFRCTIKVKSSSNFNGNASSSWYIALQRPNLVFIRGWREWGIKERYCSTRQFVCDGYSWLLTDSEFPMQYEQGNVEGFLSPILDGHGLTGFAPVALFEGSQHGFWNRDNSQSLLVSLGSTLKINGVPTKSLNWKEFTSYDDFEGNPYLYYMNDQTLYIDKNATILQVLNKWYLEQEAVDGIQEYSNIAFDRDLPKSLFHFIVPTGWNRVETFHDVK